jgi:hypothetical protein
MEPKITRRKITDYVPDDNNANLGSERGQYLLDHSIETVGSGRSLVSAANDELPIGNHALQAFVDAGYEDVIEVATDGKTVIVHKRLDWESADAPQARKAAYLDNRSQELSLTWSAEQIVNDMQSGVDLSDMFYEDELAGIINAAIQDTSELVYASLDDVPDVGQQSEPVQRTNEAHFPLAIVLTKQQVMRWAEYKSEIGVKDDTAAFLRLLDGD